MKSRIAKFLVPLAFAGAGVFAVAAPAQAASTCNGVVSIYRSANVVAVYPAYNGHGGCSMGQGTRGPEVEALQRALNSCYSAGLVVDGIFGVRTYNALRTAQSAARVPVNGQYNPTTAGAIKFQYRNGDTGAIVGCFSRY